MDLFTYLLGKKGQNTQRDLFSYLLGKGAGESGTYVSFTGTSLNISNTLRARIKNITLKGATSQDGTPTPEAPIPIKVVTGEQNVNINSKNLFSNVNLSNYTISSTGGYVEGTDRLCSDYVNVSNFTNLTMSSITEHFFDFGGIAFYDNNKDYISRTTANSVNVLTSSVPAGTIYARAFFQSNGNVVNAQTLITHKIQLEQGSTATDFAQYYSKDYPILLEAQNLFDKISFQYANGYYNQSLVFVSSTLTGHTTMQIPVKPNTQYQIQGYYLLEGVTQGNVSSVYYYNSNHELTSRTDTIRTTTYTFSTPSDCQYIDFQISIGTPPVFMDKGLDTFGVYENNYYNYELVKIGNYQDYIYGSPNNWYKYKYIQKKVFNGSEEWTITIENTNTIQFKNYVIPQKAKGLYNIMSDLFKTYSGNVEEQSITGQSIDTGVQIIINKTIANTVANFKTWLSTHNVTAYYQLNTPTEEQITDTTLIEQLNNLYNATSQEGTTYITCSSASDSNEIIVFSGDIKVASVGLGNPLNTSLLSSNLQEETNIDDIQEEPNLDDVNEIEDIEQNEEPIEEEVS